ncbi:MAG TPA: orotidine-5'-phosphate decarboxylase [Ilumatobacteraceae bacterium]|nr:orotidine-5'-phosphate decarboxylase [Ilumatobacteraceae bacterium]
MGFYDRLTRGWAASGSMMCVGLDPDPSRLPRVLDTAADPTWEFCRAIVDATADLVCAFKPQIAFFASQRAEAQLERLCTYIREEYPDVALILDAKRGDIGSTAEHYAREAFARYGAHAVTVNPYLGGDSVMPYFALGGAVIALCRTSNPGSADLQSLDCGGEPLYVRVARMVADQWVQNGECGLVVGATFPGELAVVRDVVGDLPILVPGVGAQHGDAAAAVRAGATPDGRGLIVSSSRAILYASSGDDFAAAARAATIEARTALAPATAR